METPPKKTPWGEWTLIREIIPGVWRVSTATHGGYWLTPGRLAEMPAVLREGIDSERPFNMTEVRAGWFEEDDDADRVVLTFCVNGNVAAFPDGNEQHKRCFERLARDRPVTYGFLYGSLKATSFFDRGKPKNPTIKPSGTT